MTEPQRIEISRSDQEHWSDLVYLAVYGVVFYYSLRPQDFERAKGFCTTAWDRIMHSYSVWQARREIRSLPET